MPTKAEVVFCLYNYLHHKGSFNQSKNDFLKEILEKEEKYNSKFYSKIQYKIENSYPTPEKCEIYYTNNELTQELKDEIKSLARKILSLKKEPDDNV
jgi:polyhydroxyalkanoate synthesis regulator phasin